MLRITFLLEIYLQLCFNIQDFIKIVRLLLAGLKQRWIPREVYIYSMMLVWLDHELCNYHSE